MLAVSLVATVPEHSQAAQASPRNATLMKLIEIVRTEQAPKVRNLVAGNLPQLVEWGKPDSTSAAMIDEFANLLGDRSDAVRANAASALGVIGRPAARTVPLLMQALRKAEAEYIHPGQLGPSSFSGDQICMALEQIGSTPTEAHCRYGKYWGTAP